MQLFTVTRHEDGVKLLKWLQVHQPHITRGLMEKAIRKGWIKVDKKKPNAGTILNAGQTVMLADYLVQMNKQPPAHIRSEEQKAKDAVRFSEMIIYENDELIAINKPAGLAVQGGSKQTISIDVLAKSIATDKISPRLVHRLDKDTSGVLVLAKTAKAATRLTKLFASKDIEKQYIALLIGIPKPRKGKIDLPLGKHLVADDDSENGFEKMEVDDEGKRAVTFYEVTSSAAQKYSWVNLYPITGRTHQLRVHMAEIGRPIVGDRKYGGPDAARAGDENLLDMLHLHAAAIKIPSANAEAKLDKKQRAAKEPEAMSHLKCGYKGTDLIITAPLPPHMQKAWELTGSED